MGSFTTDNLMVVYEPDTPLSLLYTTAQTSNNTYDELKRLEEPSRLLTLSRELRDEIYSDCLCLGNLPVEPFSSKPQTPGRDSITNPSTPGLLHVNKQIYSEAIEILYSQNTFIFRTDTRLLSFARQIGHKNCKRLRYIQISVDAFGQGPAMARALEACQFEHIKRLDIELLFNSDLGQLRRIVTKILSQSEKRWQPTLRLGGFSENEREKYPKTWKVVMGRWRWCDQTAEMQWARDDGTFDDGHEKAMFR